MLVVPFVDVVSTMSDPRLPATVMEYEVQMLSAVSSPDACHDDVSALDTSHGVQARGVDPAA